MTGYSAAGRSGELVYYRDRKRLAWAFSVVYPLPPIAAIFLHAQTGNEFWFFLPMVLTFVLLPLVDAAVGEDRNNPPEEVVPQLEGDAYYRYLTYLVVPMHFGVLIVSAGWAATQSLSPWAFIVLAAVTGMTSGLAINTGHELGHKRSRFERFLAQVALAIPGYGHFSVEHNHGHHRYVATFEDPASARMGESIYRFAWREIPGAFRGAWNTEKTRLGRRERSVWHWRNEVLQSGSISLLTYAALVVAFGWLVLPFIVIHNLTAWWQLTSANYIEHYGLLRTRDTAGRLERCQPHHSWNSNHLVSNVALFHLQRHSDHHVHPTRRYQSLRHFPDLPSLPNGYFGCFLLAWVPWAWFRVMDPRLLALKHVGGDLSKVNIEPRARSAIVRRYATEADS